MAWKKGQHSTCTRTHDSEESIQHVHDKKRTRKNKSIEKSETGSLNFCPEEVVSSMNLYGDGSLKANPVATNLSLNKTTDKFVMDFSSNASGPSGSTVDISAEKASRFKLTDPDNSTKSTPVFMNSSNGKKKSSGIWMHRGFNLKGIQWQYVAMLAKEHPKENCNAPLITFRRRAKKKKTMLAESDGRNIKVEETQWLSQGHENSSQHLSLKDRSTRTAVLQDHHSPLQPTRTIGDLYLKYPRFNMDPLEDKFRVHDSGMPFLSATPTTESRGIEPDDFSLLFASDGLWEHLTNEQAVEIVYNHPPVGSAKRLVNAALQEAANKLSIKCSGRSALKSIVKQLRRPLHDISVIVLFLDHNQPHQAALPLSSARSPPTIS